MLQTRRPYDYDQRNSLLWRGVLSFIEVKLKGKDGPIKAARTGQLPQVKPIVAQAGDYARLHMALRPFQLFSICILIYGRHFTVSVYDRGGVLHSEEMAVYDMHGVTREFIAVVRRLSRDLSEYDLGRDHTARSLVPANAEASRNGYPTFLVRLNQSDRPGNVEPFSAIWQTEGKPIWTSYSLLGRGTVVWQAREYGGSQAAINSSPAPSEYIIKSAWRHISRSTESEIYRLLKARGVLGARGIATFHDGQDVIWKAPNDPSSLSKKLSVNALRPAANRLDANSDIVLHRVILSSVGKPLWDYDSREYFVRGLLDIVFGKFYGKCSESQTDDHRIGIKNLQDSKIVHRDISAGNVLLSTDPTYGFAGFITDFEFAKDLQDDVDLVELVFTEDSKGHKTFVGEQPAKSLDKGAGPEMTVRSVFHINNDTGHDLDTVQGTAQFMAVDKLQQLANQVRGVFRDLTCHDLESLFWVILYALYRKALRDAPTSEKRKTVLDVFSDYFGHIKIKDIYSSRLRLLKDLGHPDRQAPEMAFPGLVDYIDVNILKFMREYAFSVQDQISSNEVQSDPAFETVTRRSQRKRVSIPITWEMVRNLLLVLAKISTPPIVVDSTL